MRQLLILSVTILSSFYFANAQCVPDTSIHDPGFYPSGQLPCVEQGVYLDTSIQVLNFTTVDPADFGVPLPGTITVYWVKIISITGLPAGINYSVYPSDSIAAGEHACIRIYGTSNAPLGNYPLVVNATISVDLGGSPYTVNGTSDDLGYSFSVDVIGPGDPCPLPSVSVPQQPVYSCPANGARLVPVIDTGGCALPFTFAWSPAAGLDDSTLRTPEATVTVSTLYTLTVTDNNGYTFTTTAQVNFDSSPTPSSDFSFAFSGNGLSVDFNNLSANATNYSWDFGDATISYGGSPTHTYDNVDSTYTVTLIASNNCGADTISKQVQIVTGINGPVMADLGVTLSPNPNTGQFTITADNIPGMDTYNIEVFTLTGQRVYHQATETDKPIHQTIDLQNLQQGIYFLRISGSSSMQTVKLVISE